MADPLIAALKGVPKAGILTATYVGTGGDGTVSVDFGNGPVKILAATSIGALIRGDSVRVIRVNDVAILAGPANPRESTGTVLAISTDASTGDPRVTVQLPDGSKYLTPYMSTYTPVIGDEILVSWVGGTGLVIGKLASGQAVPAAPSAPVAAPVPTTRTVEFRANESWSFGANNSDVWCSATNTGAWYYGDQMANTIPDGAAINGVAFYSTEFYNAFPSSLATIGVHNHLGRGGIPAISSSVQVPNGTGWKGLPASFGDAFKTGNMLGIGTKHGGFHKYLGRPRDANSGLLRITFTA